MPTYHEALPMDELTEGKGRCVTLDGRKVALFLVEGEVYAIEDECLHQGGSLSDGRLRDTTVICPLHDWEFNVTTGRNDFNPEIKVRSFPVRIEEGVVHVGLEPREEPPS